MEITPPSPRPGRMQNPGKTYGLWLLNNLLCREAGRDLSYSLQKRNRGAVRQRDVRRGSRSKDPSPILLVPPVLCVFSPAARCLVGQWGNRAPGWDPQAQP